MPPDHILARTAVLGHAIVAGMPAPIPFKNETFVKLSSTWLARAQAISFFAVALIASALFVRFAWNSLARDLTFLPRLSFRGAMSGVVLWGLGFIVVLTMIAGARELMTPGAWTQEGATYKLRDANLKAESPRATAYGSVIGEPTQ